MGRGLGFKDFLDLNSSLLAKQAWRIFDNPDALWVRVLKGRYFSQSDFVHVRRRRADSWSWASTIHGQDEVMKSTRWLIGDGESINVKEDRWLSSEDTIENQERVGGGCVSEMINGANKCWNLNSIRQCFDPGIAKKIMATPISRTNGKDSLCWPPSK